MLRTRVAVAAVGLPLLAALLATPEAAFAAAVTILLAAAAFELMRAAAPQAGTAAAVAAGAAVVLLAGAARTVEAFRLWALLPLAVLALALMLPASRVPRRPAAAWWLLAVLYVGVPGGHWLLLRNLEHGELWVAVGLATTFASDTGAYAAGRLVGRRLLAPALSPGKTWEGAGGGVVAGAAAALASIALLDLDASAGTAVAIAAGLPVAAIAGDLVESAIKRRAGVKDMSSVLSGHGGLLDRMDSLLLTGPLLYWLLRWLAM